MWNKNTKLGLVLALAVPLAACSENSQDKNSGEVNPNAVDPSDASAISLTNSVEFRLVAPDATDPNDNSAGANCAGTYPEASAILNLVERASSTTATLNVSNAAPNTLFTAWLRLKGTTDDGVAFGGNPLTGRGSTPLAPSSALPTLLEATGDGMGQTTSPNGLITDENGNGSTTIELDFPIATGAYPFQKFADFDPADARYNAETPSAHPVAIVNSATGDIEASFMIRVVSHCTDNLAHGLEPGVREPWFEIYGL